MVHHGYVEQLLKLLVEHRIDCGQGGPKSGDVLVEMLSPIEGVITTVNRDVIDDPTLATRDPYKDGWIAMVKSPDFVINSKNLVQGPMVAPWMQNNVSRLNAMVTEAGLGVCEARLAEKGVAATTAQSTGMGQRTRASRRWSA